VGEFEFDDLIDQLGSNGLPKVLFVTGLGSDVAFRSSLFVFRLRRLNNVGGGGLKEVREFFLRRASSSATFALSSAIS